MISREIIEELAAEELVDANAKHEPKFNSMHEAYAVLKEELEEMQEEVKRCDAFLDLVWRCVKADDDFGVERKLKDMKSFAVFAVQEGIQVIAMCDKAMKLY